MSPQNMHPIVKWAGGKKRSADIIVNELRKENFNTYFEPFVGGAVIFLQLEPQKAVLNDYNKELISTYEVIKTDYTKLQNYLDKNIIPNHSEDFYYEVRSWDRKVGFSRRSKVEKAARFLYLNKTCFNGIYRVNSNNQYNVPFGKYDTPPTLLDKENAKKIHNFMNENDIKLLSGDYSKIDSLVKKGDLVYFDPPYDINKNDSEFTGYTQNGFRRQQQEELKTFSDKLIEKGATVYISNSNTEFINELYLGKNNRYYQKVDVISIHRTIGSVKKSRRVFNEILIKGKKENV